MELLPLAGAAGGSALLGEGIGAGLSSILPVMEGASVGLPLAGEVLGPPSLSAITGLGGISSASLGKGAGAIIGATTGSALNASLEGVLKGGELGPKLPLPSPPSFIGGGGRAVPASSPNAANLVVSGRPSVTVGMPVGSEVELLRRRMFSGR